MNIFKPQTPFTGIKQTDLAQAWQQNRETLNRISALFHVIIGGANSVAQTVMLDTIALLSKTNQYKGKAKHNAHLAVKRYNNFDRQNMDDMRNKQLDKRQFYMDYLDDLEERLKPDVFRFRLAIKQVLDKRKIADSELKSYILCIYEMLHYCVTLFDRFIEELPSIPPINFKETYRAARLDGVFTAWDNLTDVLCRDCANIRLDDDPNCRLALNIIETKIVSEQSINQSGKEALSLNPTIQLESDRAEMNHHRKPFQPLQFTDAQMEYLKSSYSTTKNIDLAKTLGISLSKLNKLAKELALTKQN